MAPVRLFPVAMFALMLGCSTTTKETGMTRKISSEPWGKTKDGEQVELYTLTNAKGASATIMTYGGRVVTLKVPDLLVLDLMLPHVDGLEICRRVRAHEHTANIPIIMLTARAEESAWRSPARPSSTTTPR